MKRLLVVGGKKQVKTAAESPQKGELLILGKKNAS